MKRLETRISRETALLQSEDLLIGIHNRLRWLFHESLEDWEGGHPAFVFDSVGFRRYRWKYDGNGIRRDIWVRLNSNWYFHMGEQWRSKDDVEKVQDSPGWFMGFRVKKHPDAGVVEIVPDHWDLKHDGERVVYGWNRGILRGAKFQAAVDEMSTYSKDALDVEARLQTIVDTLDSFASGKAK